MKNRPTVCSYYFPNWHVDPRNEKLHGRNWTEWQVVKYATPRFPGHEQPRIPLWGYEDESDPSVMAKKISTAAEYGVDCFIFDWYYFSNGPYRERCLNEGFLQADNRDNIKFALMWANHNPVAAHPGSYMKPCTQTGSGTVDQETFINGTNYCIEHYFSQPNYLRVNDGLYFSVYNPKSMINDMGGIEAAQQLFRDFRHRVEKAGLGKLNLDAIAFSLGEWKNFDQANDVVRQIGFDTCSNYNWPKDRYADNAFPSMNYKSWFERNKPDYRCFTESLCVPYNPVVMTGWDSSPRTVQSDMFEPVGYPFTVVVINDSAALFEDALRFAADFFESGKATGNLLHLSCWNEWTEGSYLEPDTKNGYAYLEAIRKVFKKNQ